MHHIQMKSDTFAMLNLNVPIEALHSRGYVCG